MPAPDSSADRSPEKRRGGETPSTFIGRVLNIFPSIESTFEGLDLNREKKKKRDPSSQSRGESSPDRVRGGKSDFTPRRKQAFAQHSGEKAARWGGKRGAGLQALSGKEKKNKKEGIGFDQQHQWEGGEGLLRKWKEKRKGKNFC